MTKKEVWDRKIVTKEGFTREIPRCGECDVEMRETGASWVPLGVLHEFHCPECNKRQEKEEPLYCKACNGWMLQRTSCSSRDGLRIKYYCSNCDREVEVLHNPGFTPAALT